MVIIGSHLRTLTRPTQPTQLTRDLHNLPMLIDFKKRDTKGKRVRGGFYGNIQEKWNAYSNIVFILIGFVRLHEWADRNNVTMLMLYFLYIAIGACGGIHHGLLFSGSFILQCIPIIISVNCWVFIGIWTAITWGVWVQLGVAFTILIYNAQLFGSTMVNTPNTYNTHIMLTIVSAMSLDSAYSDYGKKIML